MRNSKKRRKSRKILHNKKKKFLKKKFNSTGLLLVLAFIALLGLFSEAVRTLPVGASSENFIKMSNEIQSLSSEIFEEKLLNNFPKINKKFEKENINENFVQKEQDLIKELTVINKIDKDTEGLTSKEDRIILTKVIDSDFSFNEKYIKSEEIVTEPVVQEENVIDVPKVKETIKLAADTSTGTVTINGEETVIAGSSDKNITYMQILQNPNDLDLNLKYARQQGKAGNFKQTISTLERLNMLYPDNVEIKLYLLSVLVQADSPNKALTVIEEIKSSEDVTAEDLVTVNEIEEEMKARGKPKLWNFYADAGMGGIQNNNVNSVSKSRLQYSSNEIIGFNSAKWDRTYSGSLGLTATRAIGAASSFMINTSFTDSRQSVDTSDDFESYGLTLALDTALGNQSLSPYLMLSKTDYMDDADSFSIMMGLGGFFSVGDRHSFNYGYSYSDSKGNRNTSDTTANQTNAIGHGISVGHDFVFNEIISTSTGLGYSVSNALDKTNDFHTYDFSLRLNLAYPWAYISIGEALSFNDYMWVDTSTSSSRIRSDVTNTFDVMLTKALGDIFPRFDPKKNFFINLSYEKVFSEANISNYDYISDSVSISFSKAVSLFK